MNIDLSATMVRALDKLSFTEWKTPNDVKEKINTLQALCSRGLCVARGYGEHGAMFFPRHTIRFLRRKQ